MVHTADDYYIKYLAAWRGIENNIARGLVPGAESVPIIGVNPTVGLTFEDLWDDGDLLVYPTAGESWEILSSSASDASGGSGAATVLVQFLEDDYVRTVETLALDGTTPVAFTSITAFRFSLAVVQTLGSGAAARGSNVGDLTIRVAGAGATRGKVLAGANISKDGHFTVPSGKRALLEFVFSNINKNEDGEIRLMSTNGTDGIFSERFALSLYQNSVPVNIPLAAPFPEKTDLVLQAKSSNTSAKVTGILEFVLEDV